MILTVTPNPCLHKIVSFRGHPNGDVVIRPVQSRFQGGGKGINAARAARVMGADVVALLTCGGEVGRLMLAGLSDERIACEAVEVAEPTRMSTFIHGVDSGQLTEYLEGGSELTELEAAGFKQRFLELLPEVDLVTLNGSVPEKGLADFHAWAVDAARRAGKPAVVDTYGPGAVLAAEQGPFMLKANLDEVRSSFGFEANNPVQMDRFVTPWLERGIRYVMLTGGEQGAWLFSAEGRWRVVSPRVAELNPVGCGDALLGAMMALLDAGEDRLEALCMGAAAGAANASRVGVCDFSKAEVLELRKQVRVDRL